MAELSLAVIPILPKICIIYRLHLTQNSFIKGRTLFPQTKMFDFKDQLYVLGRFTRRKNSFPYNRRSVGLIKKTSKQTNIPMRYSLLREIPPCHSQAHFTNLAENTENKIVDSLLSAKSICCVLAHLTS